MTNPVSTKTTSKIKTLTFSGPIFTGDLSLDESVMLSIPAKPHYNVVDLAFKTKGMNACVITIDIQDLDLENKTILGKEIETRWNNAQKLANENENLREILRDLVSSEDDDLTLPSDMFHRIKLALGAE